MSDDDSNPVGITLLDALSRRASNGKVVQFPNDYELPEHVTVRTVLDDEEVEVVDLEQIAERPRDQRGCAVVHDGPSFAAYVNRLATPATTMWAHTPQQQGALPTITAVFNDHIGERLAVEGETVTIEGTELPIPAVPGRPGSPGWRDHTVRLEVARDEDWQAWCGADGKLMGMKAFATFLLDMQHTLGDGFAELMLAVTQFRSIRNIKTEQMVDLKSGKVSFVYTENNANSTTHKIELPDEIHLSTYIFVGPDDETLKVPVTALLRYEEPRNSEAAMSYGYKLVRPAAVEREAWRRICADVDAATGDVPMLQGRAPDPLRDYTTTAP